MKITLFGATGMIGGSAMREALSRGHEVTVALRDRGKAARLPDGVQVAEADAASVDDVARVAAGQDLVISATRPPEGHERLLVVMAQALLRGTCRAGSRLLLVGGAGVVTTTIRLGDALLRHHQKARAGLPGSATGRRQRALHVHQQPSHVCLPRYGRARVKTRAQQCAHRRRGLAAAAGGPLFLEEVHAEHPSATKWRLWVRNG